eukprot:gene14446-4255_t
MEPTPGCVLSAASSQKPLSLEDALSSCLCKLEDIASEIATEQDMKKMFRKNFLSHECEHQDDMIWFVKKKGMQSPRNMNKKTNQNSLADGSQSVFIRRKIN